MCRLIRRQAGCAASDIDRHGKAYADEDVLIGWIGDPDDDSDHLPVAVEQRAARIAGVHGGIDLNQAEQFLSVIGRLESPVKAGDNACTHRAIKAEGIADRISLISDTHGVGIAQDCRHDLSWKLAWGQHSNVVLRLRGDNQSGRLCAIRKRYLDTRRISDDMQAGEDVAMVVNDDAAPQSVTFFTLCVFILCLDQDKRGMYRLEDKRRKCRGRGRRGERLGDRVVHFLGC